MTNTAENTLKINKIPSLTWNWLKMNNTEISSPSELSEIKPQVSKLSNSIDLSYGILENTEKSDFYASAAGAEFDSIFKGRDKNLINIEIKENSVNKKPLVLSYNLDKSLAFSARQTINAEENSSSELIILCTSDKTSSVRLFSQTLIHAKKNSSVHVVKVQLFGENSSYMDDTKILCEENAHVKITYTVLGGLNSYIGFAANLIGENSRFDSETAYLCMNNQKLDMNHIVNHFGKKTKCFMTVKGTLYGNSQKTYRGTIDFKKGCSGSVGEEQEETLMLSPNAVNKSIPVILCGEEDVSGEHGASLGKLGDDVLFYMQSRGLSKEDAQQLAAKAKIFSITGSITDETTLSLISDYIDGAFSDE